MENTEKDGAGFPVTESADGIPTVKDKLRDILTLVGFGQVCIQYFGKTPSWLYNKINHNLVNGKTADFSWQELDQLRHALLDVSERIRRAAETL